jgi:hypothetical protein
MKKQELINHLNKLRKMNKEKWVYFRDEDLKISYKAFNTWIQILSIDNIRYSNNMESSVKDYLTFLNECLK